ncbi:MAG: lipopolysaccharide transport periplasmic protein LptA, partial [Sideroxydans sp. RIFOXYB12_FULL_59_6]
MLPLVLLLLCTNDAMAEQADRDKPVHLEADRVLIDDARQFKSFEGRVHLIQGTLNIHADRIEVREDAGGYQHLTATGHPAKFRQRY